VADAAYLCPFVVTGTRALLQLGDASAALAWVDRCANVLALRAIPGTMPALTHVRGLLAAAADAPDAQQQLSAAAAQWRRLGRCWEAMWCDVAGAQAARGARRHAEAAALVETVTTRASRLGSRPLLEATDALRRRESDRAWHPLTDREWSVAALVAEGLTNRAIAERLVVSPKTVSTHVEHILAKLGAARRAEIAAWAVRIGS
jgi:DNA-binding NarL/FixJ family response regulator